MNWGKGNLSDPHVCFRWSTAASVCLFRSAYFLFTQLSVWMRPVDRLWRVCVYVCVFLYLCLFLLCLTSPQVVRWYRRLYFSLRSRPTYHPGSSISTSWILFRVSSVSEVILPTPTCCFNTELILTFHSQQLVSFPFCKIHLLALLNITDSQNTSCLFNTCKNRSVQM